MLKTMTSPATHTDRVLTAVRPGAVLLASCAPAGVNGGTSTALRSAFAGIPAYVAEQESHPPRGSSPV